MILDYENLFSDDQAVTASAASTNLVDLGAAGSYHSGSAPADHGPGMPVRLWALVTTTFATLTSLTISVQTDDNASFSSATTLATTAAIGVATLVAGYRIPLFFLPQGTERYIRLYYTVGGSNATAGAITAGLLLDEQTNGITG